MKSKNITKEVKEAHLQIEPELAHLQAEEAIEFVFDNPRRRLKEEEGCGVFDGLRNVITFFGLHCADDLPDVSQVDPCSKSHKHPLFQIPQKLFENSN